MIRVLHRWPGLLALFLVIILAVSGTALSVFPVLDRMSAPQAASNINLAELASQIAISHPEVEQIRQSPSGRITAHWFDGGANVAVVINPSTGQDLQPFVTSPVESWLTEFHRSLFLGDNGRIVMAIGAASMLILALSGIALVARRAGGWKKWFSPLRGPLSNTLHIEIARVAVFALLLSSATALWMSGTTFNLIPSQSESTQSAYDVSGKMDTAIATIPTLTDTPLENFRELTFPFADDVSDVFTLKTDAGTSVIDQGTGERLSFLSIGRWDQISEKIYMLHTGHGASLLGLLLGILSLGVPVMGVTGTMIWLKRRASTPKIKGNAAPAKAGTIILVGSESGSTWGAAATLHQALVKAGQEAHVTTMSNFALQRYKSARNILILAATYGDGDAPASAKGFVEKFELLNPKLGVKLAVLGFGDRSFPEYCAFAEHVAKIAISRGWPVLTDYDTVDRQSPQDFARWGSSLGAALGTPLDLVHTPVQPKQHRLTLISRQDYGVEVQAPTSILRFEMPEASLFQRIMRKGFVGFQPGDLIGIVPEGSLLPRYYSLASAQRDGFIEIIVKRHPGGLCSSQLTSLAPGDQIVGFLRHNPTFHAGSGQKPLILIGAGTGIGPLAGFVRNNKTRRPIHMYFGIRHQASDFFYRNDLVHCYHQGKLHRLFTASSRGSKRRYVQDAVRADAIEILKLVNSGARIMVCGGREMAAGVADTLTGILAPTGLTLATLKAEGRYVEDVY